MSNIFENFAYKEEQVIGMHIAAQKRKEMKK